MRRTVAALTMALALGCGQLEYPEAVDGSPRPDVVMPVDGGAEVAPDAGRAEAVPALPICFPQGLSGAEWFVPTTCKSKPGCCTCVWHESSAPGHTVLGVSGCIGPGDEACVSSCDECEP